MKNCDNNPCAGSRPNPCMDIREDEVVIKLYVDECGRKVYPVTIASAVTTETDESVQEILNRYNTELENLRRELADILSLHDTTDTSITNIIARIAILERIYSSPLNFDWTSILARITALEANQGGSDGNYELCYNLILEILNNIRNITEQLNQLINNINGGGGDCISNFSNPLILEGKEITVATATTTPQEIVEYSGADVNVYNVTPGSTIRIKVTINNTADWTSESSYNTYATRVTELYQFYSQQLTSDYLGSAGLIEGTSREKLKPVDKCAYNQSTAEYYANEENDGLIVVPQGAVCIAVVAQHIHSGIKVLSTTPTITLVECPDSEGEGEGGDACGFNEWIGNLKNVYTTLQSVLDDTVRDVTFAGTSVVDASTRIATLPPFVSLHGYVRPNDFGKYKTGYFLDYDLTNYYPSEYGPKINRGLLLPKYKIIDYCLYPLAEKSQAVLDAWNNTTWNSVQIDFKTAHPQCTYITNKDQLIKGILWATNTLYSSETHNSSTSVSGSTSNFIVAFYDISSEKSKYNFKLRFKNQHGATCRYAFYSATCPVTDSSELDTDVKMKTFVDTLISSSSVCGDIANESTEITLNNIPPTANTLCISFHVYGTGVVEKIAKFVNSTYDNDTGDLSLASGESIVFGGFADENALDAAEATISGLTTSKDVEHLTLTLTNETDQSVSVNITFHGQISNYEFGDKLTDIEAEATPIGRSVPMAVNSNNTQYAIVNYYSGNALDSTFLLVPFVPFYEIDTARFMYVNNAGYIYEC